jgi:LmbE family N-acetylglucosaminyl deacetylase
MFSGSQTAAVNVRQFQADPHAARATRDWLADWGNSNARRTDTATLGVNLSAQAQGDLLIADRDPPTATRAAPLKAMTAAELFASLLLVPSPAGGDGGKQALKSPFDGMLLKPVKKDAFLDQALSLPQPSPVRYQRERKRVLAIGAHPDDVEIGCGGTLAKHQAMGDEIMILTLSRGAVGGDTETRAAESARAAELLGAKLELADLPDTCIPDGVQTIEVIQAAIRSFSPTHIYTHTSHDAHQDHRSTHVATLVAGRSVSNIYCYQSPSTTIDFRPNHFVDISAYIQRKIEVLAAHESQVSRSPSLQPDVNYSPAEPMEIIRQCDR